MQRIYEYAYDDATLQISRNIIKVFKQFLYHEEDPGDFYSAGDYNVFGVTLPVIVGFVEGNRVETSAAIAFNKKSGTPFMRMSIVYRSGRIKEDFNDIVTEVKSAVRHELEHMGQIQKKGKAKIDWTNPASNIEKKGDKEDIKLLTQYYLLPHEVEAHVKGLLKQAKVKRVPLLQEIEKFVAHLTGLKDSQRKKILNAYVKYANVHGLFKDGPISKTYTQNNENKMNTPKVLSFNNYQKINEKESAPAASTGQGGLKSLVGKSKGEDLNVVDAKRIGQKISKMSGKARQKYIGIVNFMGASCKVFNAIWQNYKPVDKNRKTLNQGKEFHKPVEAPVQ